MAVVNIPENLHSQLRMVAVATGRKIGNLAGYFITEGIKKYYEEEPPTRTNPRSQGFSNNTVARTAEKFPLPSNQPPEECRECLDYLNNDNMLKYSWGGRTYIVCPACKDICETHPFKTFDGFLTLPEIYHVFPVKRHEFITIGDQREADEAEAILSWDPEHLKARLAAPTATPPETSTLRSDE